MADTASAVVLRNMVAGDTAYVMSTWLRDLRDADPGPLPDDLWFDAHRGYLSRALTDRRVKIVVAAAADNPNEILGYAVAIPKEAVLWVQVRKGALRGQGLARAMLSRLECPPGTPSAFSTTLSRLRLSQYPPRGRSLRSLLSPDPRPSPSPERAAPESSTTSAS